MAADEQPTGPKNRRFEFIEWKLFWEGSLNRSDVEEAFGLSTPQASIDLRRYRELAGDNIAYDATSKAFKPTSNMVPSFLRVSADRLLLQLRALKQGALSRREIWFKNLPAVDVAPDLVRHAEADCLRPILEAIRAKRCVEVRYDWLANARPRRIAPHALAFDGHRWHVRAWACDREDFRDFVLTRIDRVEPGPPADFDAGDDVEWTTVLSLDLRPHPGLTDEQRQAVQHDYAMIGGRRAIEVRLAMAHPFIMRLNLDLADLPPARAQVRLHNLAEVTSAIQAAKDETKRRIAERKTRAVPPATIGSRVSRAGAL